MTRSRHRIRELQGVLTRQIKTDLLLLYEMGATTGTTTPPMSFALRRGVCQNFAHVMISGLRGIGLPRLM